MANIACSLEMCRCCGNISDLNELIQINFAAEVKQELVQCWKIEITDMDRLPKHICRPCRAKFDDYLNFRKKCIKGQDKLKTLYHSFKSMIGKISIKKKSDEEYRKNYDNDSGINKINADNAEKITNATQTQNKYPEKIASKIISVSNAHKDVIATQIQNQSTEGRANNWTDIKTYAANTKKRENAMQKQIQIQSSQGIVRRLLINEKNEDSTQNLKNTSQKQSQIQSSQEIANSLTISEANEGSIQKVKYTPQKQIQIQSSQGICNRLVIITQNRIQSPQGISSMEKIENSPQKANPIQTFLGIDSKMEINKINVGSIQEIENTPQKSNQIQFTQRTGKRLVKTNISNEEKNLNKMQKQHQYRICNSSAKDAVEFIGFPDITYSKATISKTYMKGFIERKIDNTNTDPLDNTEIDIINTEPVQQDAKDCTPIDDTEMDIINTEPVQQHAKDCKPIKDTEMDITNTESVQQHIKDCTLTEEKTENILDVKETTRDFDSFIDETSQSTTVSDRCSIESDKPKETTKLDNKLVKDIENYLDETVPLKCKYCISDIDDPLLHNKSFPTKEKLIEHILSIHNPELPYKCQFCKRGKYPTSEICIYHIMHAHKQNRVICEICGLGRGPLRSFIEHIKRFHSFGDYECEICGKKFENAPLSKFEYHKRWHNKNRQMQCAYCARIFVQLPHLQAHEMIHTKNYKIKCEICGAGFKTQHNKAVHMYELHGRDKPLKCLYCDKRFTDYFEKNKHMGKIHNHVIDSFDEKVQCLKCKKQFRREASYRRHLEICCLNKITKSIYKSVKKFPCGQCSYRFKTEPGLKQHLKLHSKEGRPFECHLCNLNYKSSSNLDIHRRLRHSSNKPYECNLCEKSFAFKYILNSHRKSHKINKT